MSKLDSLQNKLDMWQRICTLPGTNNLTLTPSDVVQLRQEVAVLYARIAELETKIRHNALWQASEDAEERAHLEKLVLDLKKRIAELKGFIGQLIEAGDAMSNAHSMWVAEEDKWDALVKDWKERER